ncbi:13403_t:CDS:2 [Gigaspora rosea]|nr:13403_t:CDS:2 [Gigaspora rosea]
MLNALVHIEVDTIILDRKKQKLDDTLEGAGYKQAKEKFKQPQTKSGQISETLPYLVNQYQEGKYPDLQKSQLEPDSKSGMDILDKTIQVKNHENKTQDMETMSNGTIEEDVNKTPSIL